MGGMRLEKVATSRLSDNSRWRLADNEIHVKLGLSSSLGLLHHNDARPPLLKRAISSPIECRDGERSHLGYTSRLRWMELGLCTLIASRGSMPLACGNTVMATAVLLSNRPLRLCCFGPNSCFKSLRLKIDPTALPLFPYKAAAAPFPLVIRRMKLTCSVVSVQSMNPSTLRIFA